MASTNDSILKASFFGPYVPQANSKTRVRQLYPSIAHWYESVKFMPARPDLRDSVLFCPTIKEARKFSKSRQQFWRNDWNLIRHSVLIAGLGFLALDRPDLELGKRHESDLAAELEVMLLPTRFIGGCVERFHLWAQGPCIGIYGANNAPEGIVGKKLSKLVQANPSWTLVSLCNNKAAWRVHDWALAHYVPVKYVGTIDSRITSSVLEQLVVKSDHVVIFELRGGRNSDAVIRMAKAQKRICTLELYRQEDIASTTL
jgi:hypothetical protein